MRHAQIGTGKIFSADKITPEDPVLISYLWSTGNEVAVLTRHDGSALALDRPSDVLAYGISAIEAGTTCRVGDGIKRKLMTLCQRWSDQGLSGIPGTM